LQDEIEAAKNRHIEEEELKEAAEVPIEQLLEEWKAMVQKDEAQVTHELSEVHYFNRKSRRRGRRINSSLQKDKIERN
jgi:hypothetical protein